MKRLLPAGFVLTICIIAWVTGPHIQRSMTPIILGVLMGMFPGIVIALIALSPTKTGRKRIVIPSEFSRPLEPFNGPSEPNSQRGNKP